LGLIAIPIGSIIVNLLFGLISVENLIVDSFAYTWLIHKPNCNKFLHFCWSIFQVGAGMLAYVDDSPASLPSASQQPLSFLFGQILSLPPPSFDSLYDSPISS